MNTSFRKVKTFRQLRNLGFISPLKKKNVDPVSRNSYKQMLGKRFRDYSFASEETAETACDSACFQSWQGHVRSLWREPSPFSPNEMGVYSRIL